MNKDQFPRGLYRDISELARRKDAQRREHVSQQITFLKFLQDHANLDFRYLLSFLANQQRPLEDLEDELCDFFGETTETADETINMLNLADYIIEIHRVIKLLIGLEEGSAEGSIIKKEVQEIIKSDNELWEPVKRALLLLLETYTPHIEVSHIEHLQIRVSGEEPATPSKSSSQGNVISLDFANRRPKK